MQWGRNWLYGAALARQLLGVRCDALDELCLILAGNYRAVLFLSVWLIQ